MPMMPFIGVRISWLMLARNSLLARLAASAASLASRMAASACFSASTSVCTPTHSRIPPPLARMGTARTSMCRYSPSWRRSRCSTW